MRYTGKAKSGQSEALVGEIQQAFSPAQAAILLRLLPAAPPDYLSTHEAASRIGWTYDTFRKEPAFDAANVAPQGRHKRYELTTLLRIAENLRKTQ